MFPCKSYEHCIDSADTPKTFWLHSQQHPPSQPHTKPLSKKCTSEDHEAQHEFLQALIQKPFSMGPPHISAGTETLKLLGCQNPFPEMKKRKSQGHGFLPLQAS